MKGIVIMLLLMNLSTLAQINSEYYNDTINNKIIDSFKYHAPKHKSPRFKITFTSAINKKALQQLVDEPISSIDEFDVTQIAKYNMRFRLRLKNKNRVYLGAETMTDGYKKNIFYIGMRKYF